MRNDLVRQVGQLDSLRAWVEAYFALEVTTSDSSRKVQRRDLGLLVEFLEGETGDDYVDNWTPRFSRAFLNSLRNTIDEDGSRHWNDRTLNRVIAHLKTFAKWVHRHRPFRLGEPMAKMKALSAESLLSVERALTESERRRILDAADLLLEVGGRSNDRNRHRNGARPVHKKFRPYRNRAIVYCLIETGMRRAAVTALTMAAFDADSRTIRTLEKGDLEHCYKISREGAQAVQDYLEHERPRDEAAYPSGRLFLPAAETQNRTGILHPNAINQVWNQVCDMAGVQGKTPHSARHAMGRHLGERFGHVEALQRQLGHKNAAYSLQYTRATEEELTRALDKRDS